MVDYYVDAMTYTKLDYFVERKFNFSYQTANLHIKTLIHRYKGKRVKKSTKAEIKFNRQF